MKSNQQTYSCEFFPPRTDKGWENWHAAFDELVMLKPEYFSCTYGAGGTNQSGTVETIQTILDKGADAVPHLTCIGSTREKLSQLLDEYKTLGMKRIVALRGDLPEGMTDPGEFRHANELVAFIRDHMGNDLIIEVAAYPEKHPEAKSFSEDLASFKKKLDAGANSAITQYFYNADAYYKFIDSCQSAGIDAPIVPGIMPITNHKQLIRFSDNCGAIIPGEIRTKLEAYGDDLASIRAFGFDVVTGLCQKLLEQGAPGLHFYTLNRAEPTAAIWKQLRL